MPHHDKEENTTAGSTYATCLTCFSTDSLLGITDQVAKESSDSNASTHPMHQVDTGATSGGKATAQDHAANPVSRPDTEHSRDLI